MSIVKTSGVQIEAISACVPGRVVKTEDYPLFTKSELKFFQSGTGVKERRFADNNVCASDLCERAARAFFDSGITKPEEIGVIIFVTQSPDYILPASAILLQERLQLGKNVLAFDINLGCSGYIYGLSVISSLMTVSNIEKGLLLCGDVSSPSLSYEDKSVYPLFGDAGTATLLRKGEAESIFNLQTDGSGHASIIIPGGGTRNPVCSTTFEKKDFGNGIIRADRDLHLDGVEVFNFALREVKPNVVAVLHAAGVEQDDIDYLIMHQANKLMNETVRKKMKFPEEKVPYSIDVYGNTSSASIPLTIAHCFTNEELSGKKKLLLSGFGVGYSWGSAIVQTENLKVIPVIEFDE